MAIAIDSTGSGTYDSSTSTSITFTAAHSTAGAPNFALVAILARDNTGSKTHTAVTFGGTSMTEIGTAQWQGSGVGIRLSLWGLVSPPTGANKDIVLTVGGGGTNKAVCASVAFTGVDTGAATSGATGTQLQGTSISRSVTSATGDLVLAAFGADKDNVSHTSGGGQTEEKTAVISAGGGADVGYRVRIDSEAGAASVTMDWSFGGTIEATEIAFSLKAGAGGGGGAATRVRPQVRRAVGGAMRR